MSTTSHSNRTADRTPGQYLALAIGVAYTLIGVLGFFVTGFDGFIAPEGDLLLGFEVNPLHNIVHLLIGAGGLALWRTRDGARTYGLLLLVGYGATFVYGLFTASQDTPANFLALNSADNVLHAASAIAGGVTIALAHRGRDSAYAGQAATTRR